MTDDAVFEVGDFVYKLGGDYHFQGTVVDVFYTTTGNQRYVVEDDRGQLKVFGSEKLGPQDIAEWRQVQWAIWDRKLEPELPMESRAEAVAEVAMNRDMWTYDTAVVRRTVGGPDDIPYGTWVPVAYPLRDLAAGEEESSC